MRPGSKVLRSAGCRPREKLLGGANSVRARALGALLDVELDTLAAAEAVEVEWGLEAVAMEEVLLLPIVSDEAKASIRDDALDSTGGHEDLQYSRTAIAAHGPFEREATTRSFATRGGER
jgi:hypothetical protein